jgi:RimJ/RimL family protein N-acetyltransferase
MKDIYRGALVRLSSVSPDEMAKSFARWNGDTEIHRLADTDPAQLWSEKKIKEHVEKQHEKDTRAYRFALHTLADDKLIGIIGLVPNDTCEDAWLYIVIHERDYLSKGYGTDAMKLIMQYGFLELNLRRITLGLHGYNERAFKTYEKVGFKLEGRMRGEVIKDGVRHDDLYMGILREEWEAA